MDRPPLVDGEKDCCRKKGGEAFTAAELGKATHLAALEREVRRAVKHVVVAGTYALERGGKKKSRIIRFRERGEDLELRF